MLFGTPKASLRTFKPTNAPIVPTSLERAKLKIKPKRLPGQAGLARQADRTPHTNPGTHPRGQSRSLRAVKHAAVCLAFSALVLTGCTSLPPQHASEALLAARLRALDPLVSPAEANLAATASHSYSLQLAQQYRVVRPPFVHNTLVNLGLKQRGLCYHWAGDLYARLRSLDLHTLELRLAVARRDTRREHNSVVLVAAGQSFHGGIVLDPWRRSGRLYWADVAADKYPWTDLGAVLAQREAPAQTPVPRSPSLPQN